MPSDVVISVDKKSVDVDQALLLYLKTKNFHEVARQLGCSAQNIQKRLRRYKSFLEAYLNVDKFREVRGDVFTAGELVLFRSLVDEAAIQKAPLAARATAFGIINERRRLEEDKSTANVGLKGILKLQHEALDKTVAALTGSQAPADGVKTDKAHTKKRKNKAK